MFTGIVTSMGRVAAVGGGADARRLSIETGGLSTAGWQVGDSVAVSGVCLTLVDIAPGALRCRALGRDARAHDARTARGRQRGESRACRCRGIRARRPPGHRPRGRRRDRAHLRRGSGFAAREVEAPAELARFIAEKGSVTLDGVSLTVGRVAGAAFAIDLIPHTRKVTTLGSIAPGEALNLEVDLLARYLDRLLEARGIR